MLHSTMQSCVVEGQTTVSFGTMLARMWHVAEGGHVTVRSFAWWPTTQHSASSPHVTWLLLA
jgi:hypothetical protein